MTHAIAQGGGPTPPLPDNPFTPSFGEVPLHLAGRAQLVSAFKRAYSSASRHPNLTSLISGARGTGKTTLLATAMSIAEGRGWVAVSTTSLPGMLDDIEQRLEYEASHLIEPERNRRVTSLGVGPVSVGVSEGAERAGNWRTRMTALLDALAQQGTGVVIAVDEVQPGLGEMVLLAAVYQHFVVERRKVSLLLAGLPHNVSALLRDKSVSFLRRAQAVHLGRIADYEVSDAFRRTVEEAGRSIGDEALGIAAQASEGLPFMMQLVGFRSWEERPSSPDITSEDVRRGASLAREELEHGVLASTWAELSAGDRAYLSAMLKDERTSSNAEIARRLGKSASYASQYRRRLLEQGVIDEVEDGGVAFALPGMRAYVGQRAG